MADWLKKQVVVVVEGTAAFGPYWPTVLNDYLNNRIRSFSQNGSSSSSEEVAATDCHPSVEFAIVVFNACGSSSSKLKWLLQQSNWTNDVNCVLKWLADIDFSSFSSSDDFSSSSGSATAQGLAQALTMFRSKSNESQNQRHCILVAAAASNPESPHPDVEKVAKLFPQSNVFLSFLYPLQQLQKLGAISNAGKHNPSHNPSVAAAADDDVDDDDDGVETIKVNLHHLGVSDSDGNSNYVKVWKGELITTLPPGLGLRITILKAYMHPSVTNLVKDWPSYLHIEFVRRPRNLEIALKKYAEMSHLILFDAMWSHRLLKDLQRRDNCCGIIKLPSQLLVFTVTDDPSRFLGFIDYRTPEQQQILLKKLKLGQARRRFTDRGHNCNP